MGRRDVLCVFFIPPPSFPQRDTLGYFDMTLKATIDAIDADIVTIRTMDGQTIKTSIDAIHGTPKIGNEIRILFSTGMADQAETQDLARALLNELIQPSK